MSKYYKVVQETINNEYWSASHLFNHNNYEYSVRYKIGEFVKPTLEGSKLFVFDCLLAAKYFADFGGLNIFRVEVVNPVKHRGLVVPHLNTTHIELFWRTGQIHDPMPMIVPSNTVLCDEVKLLGEV